MKSTWEGILASMFLDFGRFWEARWEGKWSQDRPKKASKNDAKNSRNQIAKKVAIRIPNPARHLGFWVLGRGRGRDKSLPEGRGKWMTPVQNAKPPQPRGLVGLSRRRTCKETRSIYVRNTDQRNIYIIWSPTVWKKRMLISSAKLIMCLVRILLSCLNT